MGSFDSSEIIKNLGVPEQIKPEQIKVDTVATAGAGEQSGGIIIRNRYYLRLQFA